MNITKQGSEIQSRVTLGRKLHLVESLNGHTAVAFAGDGSSIRTCLRTLEDKIDEWELLERPMRHFGDNIRLYKMRIEAIAAYVPKISGAINSMMRGPEFYLPNLGLCASIGSGDSDLESSARGLDSSVTSSLDIIDRIEEFATALNGLRLARELTGEAQESWGGFVEYAFNNPFTRKWDRGRRSLNFFYSWDLAAEQASIEIIDRAIAYDPGGTFGSILSICTIPGSETKAEFQLTNDSTQPQGMMFWREWRPEVVIVTFIVKHKDYATRYYSTRLGRKNMEGLIFELGITGSTFGLLNGVLQNLVDILSGQIFPKVALDDSA